MIRGLNSGKSMTPEYLDRLKQAIDQFPYSEIHRVCERLKAGWKERRSFFLCGNGGSAGNSIHLANDFLYGAGVGAGRGLAVESLASNSAVLTCLANDLGYEDVFSEQLRVKAVEGDMLWIMSGSGNSPNVIRAAEIGSALNLDVVAIVGFDGGILKNVCETVVHFSVDDMQVAEDMQLIVGHYCMKWLSKNLQRP